MMRFHHMGVFVSDLDEALKLWVGVLGFTLTHRAVIPDGRRDEPGTRMAQETLDEGVARIARAVRACLRANQLRIA